MLAATGGMPTGGEHGKGDEGAAPGQGIHRTARHRRQSHQNRIKDAEFRIHSSHSQIPINDSLL